MYIYTYHGARQEYGNSAAITSTKCNSRKAVPGSSETTSRRNPEGGVPLEYPNDSSICCPFSISSTAVSNHPTTAQAQGVLNYRGLPLQAMHRGSLITSNAQGAPLTCTGVLNYRGGSPYKQCTGGLLDYRGIPLQAMHRVLNYGGPLTSNAQGVLNYRGGSPYMHRGP